MIEHRALGDTVFGRSRQLKILLDKKKIALAGNARLKIYGKLNCASGKRMKMENRVFFASAAEAVELGYRPCGHCIQEEYMAWKYG